ncbi:aspartyl-tRNA synthetase [Mollisia scopiformis]|uniref:Aspartyl-tRNA synthetase n=1 Tax=Mollisia scopiformis TaxID=149040 RepID=A0A132BCE2_MOLSC|nr:aspartyl-tRNA synthetase [Mollisia scopiformis]KUJ09524.1 aspartyl-tRNA synthetase [Mollisia scopiformis]
MNIAASPRMHVWRRFSHKSIRTTLYRQRLSLPGQSLTRCFHHHHRLGSEVSGEGSTKINVADAPFWKEFRGCYHNPLPNFKFSKQSPMPLSWMGNSVVAVGFLQKIANLGEALVFAHLQGPGTSDTVQLVCQDAKLCKELSSIRLGSPINITGNLALKRAPKREKTGLEKTPDGFASLHQIEINLTRVIRLNTFPADLHHGADHVFSPQDRHLQIRYDSELKERLLFRSEVAKYVRQELHQFQEIETPILFKSTPEGAKEFLVPTRRHGYAYALPQSPQQYKQILMSSGVSRYFQFAKCFRDEDLRADRQPEFTQIDLEMAFTDGMGVMRRVEQLIKNIYKKFARPGTHLRSPLPQAPFHRITYEKAMSKYGSDKPDLRLKGLIHRIDQAVNPELHGMITSIKNPKFEAFKIRLGTSPSGVQKFISAFMDSPDAEIFRSNPDGAPGICVYDPSKPLEGLLPFGFEGAQKLKELFSEISQQPWENEETHEANRTFDTGDLLVFQARPGLPHSGGSTFMGKLRLAIEKASLAEGLIEQDLNHLYLWVTDFPMFTLENGSDPGQGGKAGFSATHHPFTAPKTAKDVDLLLWKPLEAKADHYDLVVNGVELGGGSRRIHNAEMQEFIMRDILKMSEERINDFAHLIEALRAGCPPHAGLAIGFDRLIAVMTGRESVKDVIAFPKSSKGEDMMVKSPAVIRPEELKRYGLELRDASTETL